MAKRRETLIRGRGLSIVNMGALTVGGASIPSRAIVTLTTACDARLDIKGTPRGDLCSYCVEWGVKLYSLTYP